MMGPKAAARSASANSKSTAVMRPGAPRPKNDPPFKPVELTFPSFRKLPAEIRMLIWEYAQPTFLHLLYPHLDAATQCSSQPPTLLSMLRSHNRTLYWKLLEENTRKLIAIPHSESHARQNYNPRDPRLLACFESHQVAMRQRQKAQQELSGGNDSFSWKLSLKGKFSPSLPPQLANTQHFGNWYDDLLYLGGNYGWDNHAAQKIPSSASILFSMGTTFIDNPGIRRLAVRTMEKALNSLDIGKGGSSAKKMMLDTDGTTKMSAKDRLGVALQEWKEPALLMLVVDMPLCGQPQVMRWQYRFELVWGMREKLKLDGGGSGFVGYEQACEYCRWFYQTKCPGPKRKSEREKKKVDRVRAVLKEVLDFLGKTDVIVKVVVDVNRGFGGGKE
ncbi:hypothetical protein B0T21DRAFT_450931 [Apiosordaria backusii]|uniref:2EXR domain-containing protein n=1 Tax=Apiosordaria backusii TaxID=314023 RepID=A0AA40EG02_9PEZI|nr:hypothetical protein B0T21DRAFT_450931 [Apiosordaria backusii]